MICLLSISVNDDLVGVLPLCDRLALCLPLHRVQEGGLSLKPLSADLIWGAHYQLSTHNFYNPYDNQILLNIHCHVISDFYT